MSSRQCLPIDEDSSSDSELNFNLEEISALKYLKQVRSERKKIPKIVSIDIPEKYRDIEIKTKEEKLRKFDQTKEWQDVQKDAFEQLQSKINKIRENADYERNILEILPVDLSDANECISYCKENDPKLSFMLALDQGRLENLIEQLATYLAENIENNTDNCWITKWIYSSLACLHLPLDPEMHSSIRVIAKACIQLLDNQKNENKNDLPYKLLITIIANNFHQFDLLSL
ncbi:hypothetical protein PVAND_007075 [Polypedilum vanderplanki]|uniref:Gem-associated protein 2 n=1 Tax=Polypedilum vanderplanki TaxID=319348 RepID=A0A9J6C5K6_POLVA|nr:hypothetical protein PVAND_007075 [Polypedilum vanderplanki]